MPHQSVIRSMSKAAAGSTDEEICLDTWPADVCIEWHRIVARNVTSQDTKIELYLKRGRQKYLIRAGQAGAADRTIATDTNLCAPGDFQVCASFSDPSSGDVLELYAFGMILPS